MIESFHMTLAPERSEVGRARRFVVDIATAVGQQSLADVVELLTSELVTNVVLHAAGDAMRINVAWAPPTFRVEVTDDSPVAPQLHRYGPEAGTGRGLALVDSLASAWGSDPGDDGKSVWFEVAAEAV
jgi:anti-sigma regulatory factor (Ser/Thr protein kinase)